MRNEINDSVVVSISKDELQAMMEKAVQRGLEDVGLYTEDADDRRETREDMRFLRRWRRAIDGAAGKIGYTFLAVLVGAFLLALWTGIKVHVLRQ
ncbi:MAG: hypothetical protein ABFE07_21225 [Armatimonadia bacterium]